MISIIIDWSASLKAINYDDWFSKLFIVIVLIVAITIANPAL